MTYQGFDIPVVLIIFKRSATVLRILDVLAKIQPRKIYLLSDEGRDDEEKKVVAETRKIIEKRIDWDCELIKHYATSNIGVYKNIGEGAKWVFEREPQAIFLEDDNLPEITFFDFCKTMLEKYRDDERVLWVCGTNYLGKYESKYSYMFTQHLLPCGWASWSEKFLKYYDGEMTTFQDTTKRKTFDRSYKSRALRYQRNQSLEGEYYRKNKPSGFRSWDYQMLYSVRSNNLLGISPAVNQIRNIGADQFSAHGGSSLDMEMTRRFCEIPTTAMTFPLIHPDRIEIDQQYEKKISKIILNPLSLRIKMRINRLIKKILHIDPYKSLRKELKRKHQ